MSTVDQTKQFLQPALLYRLKQQLVTGQVDTVQTVRHDLARHFWFYHHDIRAFVLLVVLRGVTFLGQPVCPVLNGQVALQHIKILLRKKLTADCSQTMLVVIACRVFCLTV